ncbi:MAG: hypothetical protein PHP42_09710 [Bacteroidota bacterium]|nr:hypothetical protein [Bacteroidota bacterium]
MTTDATTSKGLQWKWISIGTIVGVILSLLLFSIMKSVFTGSDTVPRIISLLGFIVMGIVIGYKSPGYTITEPALGGFLTILITIPIFSSALNYNPGTTEKVLAPVFGFLFALLGGWVGEELDHSEKGHDRFTWGSLEWGWIIAGTVMAFVLNNFFVFGFFALLRFGTGGILFSLAISFVLAGVIVGYKSPGVTIKEAAIAGVFSVVLNFLLLYIGFEGAILPLDYMIGILVGGFVLSLLGGWLGEKLQAFMENDKTEE